MNAVVALSPVSRPLGSLPVNFEAEQALLAALLFENSIHPRIVGLVDARDFGDPLHGRIFAAICRLIDRGEVANQLTLRAMFDRDQALADVGGGRYLAELANSVVTVFDADSYARTVRDLAERRRMIVACEEAIEAARNVDIDRPASTIASTLADTLTAEAATGGEWFTTAADVAEAIVGNLDQDLPCYPTGLGCLDRAIGGGLFPKFYGIAAEHKAGKSQLMGTMAYNLTMAGVPTLYLSLEMGKDEQVQRLMARLMGVNAMAFLDRKWRRHPDFIAKAADAAVKLRSRNHLLLMQRPRMHLADVRQAIARAALGGKIKGVFVDYLQLVDGQEKGQSLASHYDNVAQALAEASLRYGIFVVAAAQTNREGGIRQGDGMLKACDMAIKLHKVEVVSAPSRAWVEMLATRFTPRSDIGSENNPALELNTKSGPFFAEYGGGGSVDDIPWDGR